MPLDRGAIDQQLHALGEGSHWWDQREFRDLPAVLQRDERLLALSRGKVARLRWLRRTWLIVVTDRRLLCMRSGVRSGWRQIEVAAAHIGRVTLRIGPLNGRLLLTASGRKYALCVPKEDAYQLQTALASIAAAGKDSISGVGPTRMVRRVVDHMLALPAIALEPERPAPRPAPPAKAEQGPDDGRVELLENRLHELQKQVDFLEQLLRKRHPEGQPAAEGRRIPEHPHPGPELHP